VKNCPAVVHPNRGVLSGDKFAITDFMMVLNGTKANITTLLLNAAEWQLIALLWESPRNHSLAQISCLAAKIDDPLLKEAASLAEQAAQEQYDECFGSVPLQEAGYPGNHDPQQILTEIESEYRNSEFITQRSGPSDHVTVESEFISHLYARIARAKISDHEEAASVSLETRKKFLKEHFIPLIKNINRRMTGSVPAMYVKLLVATRYKLHLDTTE
jgi:hypothetical protein